MADNNDHKNQYDQNTIKFQDAINEDFGALLSKKTIILDIILIINKQRFTIKYDAAQYMNNTPKRDESVRKYLQRCTEIIIHVVNKYHLDMITEYQNIVCLEYGSTNQHIKSINVNSISKLTNLKKLKLTNAFFTDYFCKLQKLEYLEVHEPTEFKLKSKMDSLQNLSIFKCGFGYDYNFNITTNILLYMMNLKHLKLNCRRISLTGLNRLSKLESIKIYFYILNYSDTKTLDIKNISNHINLNELNIPEFEISSSIYLSKLINLKSINTRDIKLFALLYLPEDTFVSNTYIDMLANVIK